MIEPFLLFMFGVFVGYLIRGIVFLLVSRRLGGLLPNRKALEEILTSLSRLNSLVGDDECGIKEVAGYGLKLGNIVMNIKKFFSEEPED